MLTLWLKHMFLTRLINSISIVKIDVQSALLAQAHILVEETVGMNMLLVIAARTLYGGLQKNVFEIEHIYVTRSLCG